MQMKQIKWKKAPPELSAFLEKAVVPFPAQKRSMFGYPVWFVNNNMFAGLHQDNLFVRLSAIDQKELFAAYDEAAVLEPMPGRQMKEYAVLPESLYNDALEFARWLGRSHAYVSSLPPKQPAKAKKTARGPRKKA
jgi:TfoX/Sxy family transcriptional regulator of competence genes